MKFLYYKILIKIIDENFIMAFSKCPKKLKPNFDKNNFVYNSYVTNQIRVNFREFYENWADKIFKNKKKKRSTSLENKLRVLNFNFKNKKKKRSISLENKLRG